MNHEEYDTRVMLHAASQQYKNILMTLIDVIISFFSEIGAEKLWVSFGMGKKLRYNYFYPHLQRHVSCKSICSPCISCLDRGL